MQIFMQDHISYIAEIFSKYTSLIVNMQVPLFAEFSVVFSFERLCSTSHSHFSTNSFDNMQLQYLCAVLYA